MDNLTTGCIVFGPNSHYKDPQNPECYSDKNLVSVIPPREWALKAAQRLIDGGWVDELGSDTVELVADVLLGV